MTWKLYKTMYIVNTHNKIKHFSQGFLQPDNMLDIKMFPIKYRRLLPEVKRLKRNVTQSLPHMPN
jgi:hypothetical protein